MEFKRPTSCSGRLIREEEIRGWMHNKAGLIVMAKKNVFPCWDSYPTVQHVE
jgi:hypothetical protein